MKTVLRTALAAGTVALLAGAASTSASAAPLGQNFESLKTSAPQASTDVQWRRHRTGRNVAIGLGAFGAGVVVGSAIANQGYYGEPYGYYGPSYGYEAPYSSYTANRSGNQADAWDDPVDYVR